MAFQKMQLTPEQVADLLDSYDEIDSARRSATSAIGDRMPGLPPAAVFIISHGLGVLEGGVMKALIDTDWDKVGDLIAERHPEVMVPMARRQADAVFAQGQRREAENLN